MKCWKCGANVIEPTETVDDIVEELADKFGIYGPYPDGNHPDDCKCRICYTSWMRKRIIDAAGLSLGTRSLR